ncbi:hypothetical protein LINPERHAP2_LOCUS35257 [Linum perenne]
MPSWWCKQCGGYAAILRNSARSYEGVGQLWIGTRGLLLGL